MKKDSGEGVSSILEALISSTILASLMILVITYGNQLYTYTQIESVSRKYIQRMETYGYLTPELQDDINKELDALGVVNIDCSKSTMQKTKNGETINLIINADYKYQVFNFDWVIKQESNTHTFNLVRTSISKCYE